jgi:biopolymer transport protein ExbB
MQVQAVMRAFSEGGECMCIIAAVFIMGIAVFIERFVMLFVKYNINAVAFMSQIQKLVAANNLDRAVKLCNAAPTAALSRVIKAGLAHAESEPHELRGAIEEAVFETLPLLTKRSSALLGVAGLALCMGLLGAAIGFLRALSANQPGPELDPRGLAGGLTASVYPLVFGTIVAALSLVAHFILSGTATRIANEIKQYSVKLSNVLNDRRRSDADPTPARVDEVMP